MRFFFSLALVSLGTLFLIIHPAHALIAYPIYSINGWTVTCNLSTPGASCWTNRHEKPPFVFMSVQQDQIVMQVRQNCLFEGQAPPVTIRRDRVWRERLNALLKEAQRQCTTGSVEPYWDQETVELVDLMAAATGKR